MTKRPRKQRIDRKHAPIHPPVRRDEAIWLDGPVPAGYWQTLENRRRYMYWLGQQLGFREPRDYYRISTSDLKHNRGSGVLLHYWNSSAIAGVMECFPDYDWKEWLFRTCPRSFWHNQKNHRRYMKWFAERRGVRRPEDWYNVTNKEFAENKGGALLLHYNSTISAAIKCYLPKHAWNEWMFGKTPKGFWNDKKNRKRYMNWLGNRLGFTKPADWYSLTRGDFENNYGNQLIKFYDGSPGLAVRDCFPRYAWKEWMFARVPRGFWREPENRKRYITWLGKRLGYRKPEDWYKIRREYFLCNYGGGLLASFPSYLDLLRECLPELQWTSEALQQARSRQRQKRRAKVC